MFVDQLGHFEHRNLLLAAEYALQLGVSIDVPAVFAVLKAIALDVSPDLLGDLGTRHCLASDNRRNSFYLFFSQRRL